MSDMELAKFLNDYLGYAHDYCCVGNICMLLESIIIHLCDPIKIP